MSIATELSNLAANRDAIKNAIEAKGGTVSSNTLAAFPAAIAALPSGGGGGLTGHTVTVNADSDYGTSMSGIVLLGPNGEVVANYREFYNGESHTHSGVAAVGGYNGDRNPFAMVITEDTTINLAAPCFVEGTRVLLADGSMKTVEDVSYTDELLVWDFDEGRPSSARPLWIKVPQESCYCWKSRFASGRVLETMGHSGHRVFSVTAAKFLYVTECVGHDVKIVDGSLDRLVETVRVDGRCRYFNIITERHMNLYADGVLTSFHMNNELYPFDADAMLFVKPKSPRALRLRDEFPSVPTNWYDGLRLYEQTGSADDICADIQMRLSVAASAVYTERGRADEARAAWESAHLPPDLAALRAAQRIAASTQTVTVVVGP